MATEVVKQTRERVAVPLLGGVVLIYFLTRPPQMGVSEEVFRTVDALHRRADEGRRETAADKVTHPTQFFTPFALVPGLCLLGGLFPIAPLGLRLARHHLTRRLTLIVYANRLN